MKKIPTIFDRDWNGDRSRVLNKPHPDCGWVFAGEGHATRKLDGTCCLFRDGKLYKRREVKSGGAVPDEFEPADHDEQTGKIIGWVPVGDGEEDRWHREALERLEADYRRDGTCELVGPKIQGNPEGWHQHELVYHDTVALQIVPEPPRDFDGLKAWMADQNIEGIVWHHPDGRMAKIKLRDFGLKRAT